MFLYKTSPQEFGREPKRLKVQSFRIHLHVVALGKGYPSDYSYGQHRKPVFFFFRTLQFQSNENKACRKNVQGNQYSLFKGQMLSKPQGEVYTFLVSSFSRWFFSTIWRFFRVLSVFSLVNSQCWKEREKKVLHHHPSQNCYRGQWQSKLKGSVSGAPKDVVVLHCGQPRTEEGSGRCWDKSGHIQNTRSQAVTRNSQKARTLSSLGFFHFLCLLLRVWSVKS